MWGIDPVRVILYGGFEINTTNRSVVVRGSCLCHVVPIYGEIYEYNLLCGRCDGRRAVSLPSSDISLGTQSWTTNSSPYPRSRGAICFHT